MRTALLERLSRTLLIVAVAFGCTLVVAEDKPSRERESLRRAQLALRAAQERQVTLQAERDQLAASLAQKDKQLDDGSAERETAQRRLRSMRESEARASGALETSRGELDSARRTIVDLESRLQALREQTLDLQRQAAERTLANAAVTRLLEQSVGALAKAEAENQQLYQVGQDLLKAYRDKGVLDAASQRDPLLGFGEVRLENRAQDFRDRMNRLKLQRTGPLRAE